MPFTTANYVQRLSDIIVHEKDPSVGYARRDINITPDGAIQAGTVVFRAKTADLTAAWTKLVPGTSGANLVATNEFAIVIGDHFSYNPLFTPRAISAGRFNAVAIVGGGDAIQLKEYYIKQIALDTNVSGLSEAQFETLRGLLEAQGIQLLETL